MPDEKGKLSDEEKDRLAKFLNEKSRTACPHCGHTKASLLDHVISVSVNLPFMLQGPRYTAIATACQNCHYLKIFAADQMGEPPTIVTATEVVRSVTATAGGTIRQSWCVCYIRPDFWDTSIAKATDPHRFSARSSTSSAA